MVVELRWASALVVAMLVAGGCGGTGTPTVMPNMTTMPDSDPQERNEYLDSTRARPRPEQRAGQSPKERRAEEIAATAAAVIGLMFSSSKTVLLGTETKFDESSWFVKPIEQPKSEEDDAEEDCAPSGRLSLDPRTSSEPCER